ncbi:MAG TPA: adenosylcobinamide-GDP ribazoletransferase [Caulobacteraceae bacterium]|jgi:adenosylcobinamide-GDP ribazoletransferase|nr:adenosylcobinamide-GDP ribazoletransferase [Caulobacteraceae bacterium]
MSSPVDSKGMDVGLAREWRLFWCAVGFLTRLPTPASHDFDPDWIGRSTRWFSLVGQIVGALAAAVFLAAGRFWGGAAPAVLAVGAGVWITGAFHEDGLADTADGLGGGTTPAARLQIMKDSRIGTYGVVALIMVVGLRVAVLAIMPPWRGAVALVAAHGLGRAAAVAAMATQPYVGAAARAKAGASPQEPGRANVLFAGLVALWPFTLMPLHSAVLSIGLAAAAAAVIALFAQRLIGGRTGDTLGAVEQAAETAALLGAAALLL